MFFDEEKFLLSCPFCGSSGRNLEIIQRDRHRYYVFCHCCETEGPKAASPKLTAEAWNTNKKAPEIAPTISEAAA
ncbi:MAG: Lar family restriction alleviation protein [Desulfobacterales bacterium]